ncbi:MAG: hypothetical protein A4E63_01639 [Syntrophorhabdus sp. PtaU1.Bin050]|nr:MAG: hypothetical protein A4E63_01639 [Syntrophorhabdus sp. PtaU1.Bin050]
MIDESLQKGHEVDLILLAPRDHCPVPEREVLVGHNEGRVEVLLHPQAETGRTRPVGVIEGEHPRRNLRVTNAAVRTGKLLAEYPDILAPFHLHNTVRLVEGKLHCLEKPLLYPFPDRNPVNDHVNLVLFVLLEHDFFRQVYNPSIELDLRKPLLPEVIDLFPVLTLPTPDNGCKNGQHRSFVHGHDRIDDLRRMLACDLLAATVAVHVADPGIQKPQVVIYLRNGSDGASRVLADRLLLYADGRRKALNVIHIRLVHKFKELPRV